MPIIPAQIAIANLIDSAEKGEIDPWDVPVIETIDRFLQELGLMENAELSIAEANLPQSGQAFLWASMLVLLKADTLELLQEIEQEEENEFFPEFDLDIERSPSLPPFFEQNLRRRTSVPPRGKRRVTLQELIEQLEQIAAEIEASTTGETKPKNSFSSRRAAMKAIANLAHNENLTELAIQLENFLLKKFPQLSINQDALNWEHLLTHWHQDRPSDSGEQNYIEGFDRAGIFWALLLLSAQSKVELSQEEFYQDLSIRLPLDLSMKNL
jgi:segregation and condensation protein A